MAHKKKTNWRKQLAKHGVKVILDPLRYAEYKRPEYSVQYRYFLKQYLKKKFKAMSPIEYEKFYGK